jgi:hypothetical protein
MCRPREPESMAKYVYLLALSKELNDTEEEALTAELYRIFQAEEVTRPKAKEFSVVSPLNPVQVGQGLRGLIGRFGAIEFKAGSKLE